MDSVNSQPLLTDFPRTVFATARRRHQATIRRQRHELMESSLSGYGVMFGDVLPAGFLKEIDPTSRQRHFGHRPVLWAWLAQILEGNGSCSKAVSLVQSWCSAHGIAEPAADTSAYCKARQRLSEDFIDAVSRRVNEALGKRLGAADLWNGFVLKAIDGSAVKLMDTPANQEDYPQPCSQRAGCGFPVMAVSGLLNLSHGGWEAFLTGKQHDHDRVAGAKLIEHVGEGDLLLADRAYSSYGLIAAIRNRGGHALMRLHQQREGALDWRRGKRIGRTQRLVTWTRPAFSAVSKSMSRGDWEKLPEELEVRLIKLGYKDRCGRKRSMIVVTTLTDPELHDGHELHALYARRWEIELRLRDVKTTLNFNFMAVRSPKMAHKTLAMIKIAYNLLRLQMQRAAKQVARPVGLISFKGTLDLVTSMHEGFRRFAGRPRRASQHREYLAVLMIGRLINHRPNRSEPRAVKRRPKSFALLNAPRQEYIETPHRSRYRKSA